jgi:prophage regulatory protein
MRVLRAQELVELTGLSRSTIWRLERDGKFPERLHLSANIVGWNEDEVLEWLNDRPRGTRPYAEEEDYEEDGDDMEDDEEDEVEEEDEDA